MLTSAVQSKESQKRHLEKLAQWLMSCSGTGHNLGLCSTQQQIQTPTTEAAAKLANYSNHLIVSITQAWCQPGSGAKSLTKLTLGIYRDKLNYTAQSYKFCNFTKMDRRSEDKKLMLAWMVKYHWATRCCHCSPTQPVKTKYPPVFDNINTSNTIFL